MLIDNGTMDVSGAARLMCEEFLFKFYEMRLLAGWQRYPPPTPVEFALLSFILTLNHQSVGPGWKRKHYSETSLAWYQCVLAPRGSF